MNNIQKVCAYWLLAAATIATMLGNFWFTFGIWPKSWGAFLLFATLHIVLTTIFAVFRDE